MKLFQREQRSLFGEILDWMLTPLLLLWPISLVLTWLVAQSIAGKPFDQSFVSVATRGSLTAAANAEGVAPAIMGRRLDALEGRLGVKLLVRTTRRITLTHEGSAFLEDCQRLLADVANAEASVSAGGVKASGHLRITAPAGFGRRHVAPLIPKFRELHADVTIDQRWQADRHHHQGLGHLRQPRELCHDPRWQDQPVHSGRHAGERAG